MIDEIELPTGSQPLENQQHENLAQAYVKTASKKQAGEEAGYADKSNSFRALIRPDVQARIKFLQEERAEELGLDAYYVLNNLKTIAERCLQNEEVKDREGNSTGEYKFEHTGATKAVELIGKHLGMFNDKIKHEHTGADGKPISMSLEVVFTDESDQSTDKI